MAGSKAQFIFNLRRNVGVLGSTQSASMTSAAWKKEGSRNNTLIHRYDTKKSSGTTSTSSNSRVNIPIQIHSNPLIDGKMRWWLVAFARLHQGPWLRLPHPLEPRQWRCTRDSCFLTKTIEKWSEEYWKILAVQQQIHFFEKNIQPGAIYFLSEQMQGNGNPLRMALLWLDQRSPKSTRIASQRYKSLQISHW